MLGSTPGRKSSGMGCPEADPWRKGLGMEFTQVDLERKGPSMGCPQADPGKEPCGLFWGLPGTARGSNVLDMARLPLLTLANARLPHF